MQLNIIQIKPKDVVHLQQISRQTFIETFSEQNTAEDMQVYLNNNLSEQKLLLELNHPESEFYAAIINNNPVAYLKINYGLAQSEQKLVSALEIERIYVLKEFKGKKIGKQLMHKAFEIARSKKLNTVWLGVWEKNHNAISFYTYHNFKVFDTHVFQLGNDKQIDLLMKTNII